MCLDAYGVVGSGFVFCVVRTSDSLRFLFVLFWFGSLALRALFWGVAEFVGVSGKASTKTYALRKQGFEVSVAYN